MENFKIDELVILISKNLIDQEFIKNFIKKINITEIKDKFGMYNLLKVNKKLYNKSIKIICKLWNKDINSRKYIENLLEKFTNYNSKEKVNKLKQIKNFPPDTFKNNLNYCNLTKIELHDLNEILNAINSKINKTNKESIINKNKDVPGLGNNIELAFGTENSDIYLSYSAIIALEIFAILLEGNRDNFI